MSNEQFVFTSDSAFEPNEPALMEFSSGENKDMVENRTSDLGQESGQLLSDSNFLEGGVPAREAQERGEELLAKLTSENEKSEIEITERFGTKTWVKIKDVAATTLQKLEASGENLLDWGEKHGIPMPNSKLGNALAAGGLSIAGLAPGAGLLLGVAYIFLKRAKAAGTPEEATSRFTNILNAQSERLA